MNTQSHSRHGQVIAATCGFFVFLVFFNQDSKAFAQEKPIIPEVQAMLDDWTEEITIARMMKQRKPEFAGKHSLALAYLNRGKVYYGYTTKPRLAVEDFTASIREFEGKLEGEEWHIRQRSTEAYLYRAISRIQLKDFVLAEADASEAVSEFSQLANEGHDFLEPMLVYALKTRAESRSHKAAKQECLEGAVSDYDLAITTSREILKRGKQKDFFTKQVQEIESLKQQIEKRRLAPDSASPTVEVEKDAASSSGSRSEPPADDRFEVGRIWRVAESTWQSCQQDSGLQSRTIR